MNIKPTELVSVVSQRFFDYVRRQEKVRFELVYAEVAEAVDFLLVGFSRILRAAEENFAFFSFLVNQVPVFFVNFLPVFVFRCARVIAVVFFTVLAELLVQLSVLSVCLR